MAKTWNKSVYTSATQGRGKKTSQGRGNVAFSTMNKNKKATLKNIEGKVNEREMITIKVPESDLNGLRKNTN